VDTLQFQRNHDSVNGRVAKANRKNNGHVKKRQDPSDYKNSVDGKFLSAAMEKIVLFLYLGRVSGKTPKALSCLQAKHTNHTRGEEINTTDSTHMNSLTACNMTYSAFIACNREGND
jgi:hypothetical protein